MNLVIDANLVLALVLPLPYSSQAAVRIAGWRRDGIEFIAPLLLEYEVSAALRRATTAGLLTTEKMYEAMDTVLNMHIQCLPPTRDLHTAALSWAQRLGHTKTYDAHYVAVAEQAQAPLWTADRRLVQAAAQARVNWIHWIKEELDPLTR